MRLPAILLLLLAPGTALADEVHLRGGGRIQGVIVEETAEKVTVDIGAGRMSVSTDSVERITRGSSPLSEYRTAAAALAPDDVEGWRDLGRRAARRGLTAQAREAYSHVLESLPNDFEANEALGRVYHEGRWMDEEEAFRAQGYIQFEQEWMTPAERDSILAERQAREDAEQRDLDAVIQAERAALAEERAVEEAEVQAFWDSRTPGSGGVVWWSHGVGPSAWSGSAW